MLQRIKNFFLESYKDDEERQRLLFLILNLLLFIVSTTMSVMNIITKEYILFGITAFYAVSCLVYMVLTGKRRISRSFFFVETLILLSVFIVTGIPGGFSILWILVIPACTMPLFGLRIGNILSGLLFLDVIFFFWTPWGKSLLMYDYSDTYMLRFPFVYICLYLISLYVEWIRHKTRDALIETENKNRWLYRHDALTGAYNRHAFSEELNRTLANASNHVIATIMVDIDDFKHINDTYGHNVGDTVLCRLAEIIQQNICEHCLSCRWGGEEFLIVMGCEHDPRTIAESIRRDVEQTQMKLESGETFTFTVSAGISMCASVEPDAIIEQVDSADKAMYAAKKAGKNMVFFSSEKSALAGDTGDNK